MPADRRSLRKDLKDIIKAIDKSVEDAIYDIEADIARVILVHCDEKKLKKEKKKLRDFKFD